MRVYASQTQKNQTLSLKFQAEISRVGHKKNASFFCPDFLISSEISVRALAYTIIFFSRDHLERTFQSVRGTAEVLNIREPEGEIRRSRCKSNSRSQSILHGAFLSRWVGLEHLVGRNYDSSCP